MLRKQIVIFLIIISATSPCFAADYIYISKHNAGLLRIDMDTRTSATVSGASQYPYGSSFNRDGSELLLASWEGSIMAQRFATSNLELLQSYSHAFTVGDIEVNSDENRYYFSNWDGDKVRVFTGSNQLVSDITIAKPRFLQMSPSRRLLFAFCDPGYDDIVAVIDTETNTVVNTTGDTNLDWMQASVGFNNDESKYYIASENGARDTHSIAVYNSSTHKKIKDIDLTFLGVSGVNGSIHTRSFALGPNGRYLYMAGGQYSAEFCLFGCTPEKFNFIILDTATDTVQYLKVLDNARFLFLSADGQSLYAGSDTQVLEIDVDDPTNILNTFTIPAGFQTYEYANHFRSYTGANSNNLASIYQLLLLNDNNTIDAECDLGTGVGCDALDGLSGDMFAVRFSNGQYYLEAFITDANQAIESAYINLPGGDTSPLTYGLHSTKPNDWWTDPNIYLGTSPTFPQAWDGIIIMKNGNRYKISKTITDWEWAQ